MVETHRRLFMQERGLHQGESRRLGQNASSARVVSPVPHVLGRVGCGRPYSERGEAGVGSSANGQRRDSPPTVTLHLRRSSLLNVPHSPPSSSPSPSHPGTHAPGGMKGVHCTLLLNVGVCVCICGCVCALSVCTFVYQST